MPQVRYQTPLEFEWKEPENGRAFVLDLPQPPSGYETDQAFFYRTQEGRVVGYFNRCTHVNVPMDYDDAHFLDTNGWIMCRLHGARYDLATGEALMGPAMRPLAAVDFEMEGTMIRITGWRSA